MERLSRPRRDPLAFCGDDRHTVMPFIRRTVPDKWPGTATRSTGGSAC